MWAFNYKGFDPSQNSKSKLQRWVIDPNTGCQGGIITNPWRGKRACKKTFARNSDIVYLLSKVLLGFNNFLPGIKFKGLFFSLAVLLWNLSLTNLLLYCCDHQCHHAGSRSRAMGIIYYLCHRPSLIEERYTEKIPTPYYINTFVQGFSPFLFYSLV